MRRIHILLLVVLLVLVATAAVSAEQGAITADLSFVRERFVAMGMHPKTNGAITLRGTLGQYLVGKASNSNQWLCNGIWCRWPFLYETLMPVVLRQ